MHVFIILIAVMESLVYTYVWTYQIIVFKRAAYSSELYLNKAV